MAADIAAILRNLEAFHPLAGRSVLHVGAGGGQFIGYAVRARAVTAVDPDPVAVERLRAAVAAAGLADRVRVRCADILTVTELAEVVFFEFCLHEIADPAAALRHARTLAPVTLVADHAPSSPWSWCCGEEDRVVASWAAVGLERPALTARFNGEQAFRDYGELEAKIGMLGEPTLGRIAPYREQTAFVIPMPYQFALLR
jgi:SAM-dependent methyltransferase